MDALSPSHPARRIVFMKGSQIGAPLGLDTPVVTTDGWKTMGDLAPGDFVFDEKGQPVEVLGVSPVFEGRQCFEVCFSDGSRITADGEHRWQVEDGGGQKTLTTLQIAACNDDVWVPEVLRPSRRIAAVREVPSVPVRCIAVASPSHLFLAGRAMIPTHNTEAGVCWIGFIIHHAPGPTLIVWPTLSMAMQNSKQRIDPMILECPEIEARVAPVRTRSGSNTIFRKQFAGGILVMVGSNSAISLRSMPVRYLFLDEVDVYATSSGKGMDPVAEAINRTSTFEHRKKIFLASVPCLEGESRIAGEYEESDQRKYFIPCPRCGHYQPLVWERLRWEKGKCHTAHYVCEACEGEIAEHEKTWFLERGEWRATAEGSDPKTIGFHLSSLYSPYGWMSWETIARQWEKAQGNAEALRTFVTGILGLPWKERTDAPDWQRLYDRREDWQIGTVPEGVRILTAGADVQRDRIEVSVWGWGEGFESWLIDHIVLKGKPSEPEVWQELTGVMGQVWPSATAGTGEVFQIANLAIDSGDQTMEVYAWVQANVHLPIMCIKGEDRFGRVSPVTGPKRIEVGKSRGLRLGWVDIWYVSVSIFKGRFYADLASARPTDEALAEGVGFPRGYVHLPRGVSADFVQQLVAEQLVTIKMKNGKIRREWRKVQERNEALDCFVYSRAALWEADVYGEVFWERLARERAGLEPEKAGETPPPPANRWVPRVASRWV